MKGAVTRNEFLYFVLLTIAAVAFYAIIAGIFGAIGLLLSRAGGGT